MALDRKISLHSQALEYLCEYQITTGETNCADLTTETLREKLTEKGMGEQQHLEIVSSDNCGFSRHGSCANV